MAIDPAVHENPGFITRIKAFPGKIKAKVVDVAKRIKKLGRDDPRRIVHSLKVGLALTLVSSFYYFKPLYDGFGASAMWAVLTVVVIFEFTVGATLSKSLNRGFATLLAGGLGLGAEYLASLFGHKGEPIILGCLVFLLAAASTFSRFFPIIKRKYDYGVLIFILTFSLVSVSGYRVNEIIALAYQRLSTIIIGGATCMIISIFVCPVWAGEELQNLIALNIEKLSSFLEGFGGEYYELSKDGDSAIASKHDKSFLQSYKSVLSSKATEEALANFAWWEPGHGRFRFRHPLKQYLKIGVLIRECAYHIEALNAYLMISKLQSPTEFRTKVEDPCKTISSESGKAMKELALALKTMARPSRATKTHIQNCKTAVEDLNIALKASSSGKLNLFEILPDITVASVLIDITKSVDKISESIHELSNQANFKDCAKSDVALDEKPHLLRRGVVIPVNDSDDGYVSINIPENGNSDDVKSVHK